jgi:uncharacterized protein
MSGVGKGVVWFLVIAFGLAWISWEIPIQMGVPVTGWKFQLFGLVGAFAPAIAAIVVRKWITREGFADAGLRLHLRSGWPYYLAGWFLPLAVVGVIVIEAIAFGIAQPDFSLTRVAAAGAAGKPMAGVAGLGWLVVPQVLVTALIATPIFWGEEFGWRGYLQRRLLADRPALAAVATGLIWGVWHWPLTLRGYNTPDNPLLGSLLLLVLAVLLSIILGWLRERSGSIWAASLGHAATNIVGGLALMLFAGAVSPTVASYGGVLVLPPLAAICAWILLTGRLKPALRRDAPAPA